MALRTAKVVDQVQTPVEQLAEQPAKEVTTQVADQPVDQVKDDASKDASAKDGEGKDAEAQTDENQTVAEQGAASEVQEARADEAQAAAATSEPEVKVVAEQRQVVVESAANSQVVVPHKPAGALANFSQELADEGFEGLALTGMSFERLKLHEANFLLGSEEINLGDTLELQIMSTRNLYIVRQYAGNGAEIYYSYDPEGKTKADGSSAEETLAEWRDDGYGVEGAPLEIKRYIEGMAMLVNRDDEHEGLIVTLSIPPASRDRLTGAFAVGKQLYKAGPSNLVIQCKVGKKIGSGEEAFRPWLFKPLRAIA